MNADDSLVRSDLGIPLIPESIVESALRHQTEPYMALYEFSPQALVTIPATTYSSLNLRERQDVQRVLRDHIDAVLPDVMVLTEEFGEWEDSRRRIDLLCLDRETSHAVTLCPTHAYPRPRGAIKESHF